MNYKVLNCISSGAINYIYSQSSRNCIWVWWS